MTSRTFEKIADIFQCKLLLEDGSEFIIPLREDGYIFATGLCKAAGKLVGNWLRLKETKKLQKELENNFDIHNRITKIIEVYKAGNKYNQGTWIHPDLGLQLAQWCSPSFSLQVSKWLRELIFTGNVEIEKEKINEEINNKYQVIIKNLEEKLEYTEEKLENAEELLIKYDRNNKELSKKYNKIYLNHQYYLRRKELYKLKRGNSVYLIDMKISYGNDISRIKVGHSSDITNRVSGFRTSNPFCKVLFVMYTFNSEVIEKAIKTKYEQFLEPNNSEFISDISFKDIKESLITIANILNCDYTIESDEELEKFNKHIIAENEVEDIIEGEIIDGHKRCGGLHHDTEESRILPLSEYFKNKSNTDGYARLCKDCYLIGVYGDNRKRRKVITIPEFDTTTHKWCNLCESVKEHTEFYADKEKKDGLNANCKQCKNEQKKKNKIKKIEEKKQKEFDKTIFNDQFITKYTVNDLRNIAKNNNLNFTTHHTKVELINIIKENNYVNPLEKCTKRELMKMATDRNLKVTHRFTKSEIILLLNENE